jgi:hypothetical protein
VFQVFTPQPIEPEEFKAFVRSFCLLDRNRTELFEISRAVAAWPARIGDLGPLSPAAREVSSRVVESYYRASFGAQRISGLELAEIRRASEGL